MPELPEVERVRVTLAPHLLGRVVVRAWLGRAEVVEGAHDAAALLEGARVVGVERRGKLLALLTCRAGAGAVTGPGEAASDADGPALAIHLGMTGQVLAMPAADRADAEALLARETRVKHTHAAWLIGPGPSPEAAAGPPASAGGWGVVIFRDPRRFGGLFTHAGAAELRTARLAVLGPDAWLAGEAGVSAALAGPRACGASRRTIKSVLLDQRVLAGLGNIYADEALFEAGILPRRMARRLSAPQRARLAGAIVAVLARAVPAGGTTLRDYRDADGARGAFSASLRVYGRAGRACTRCGGVLRGTVLGQRATVWCPRCQGGRN